MEQRRRSTTSREGSYRSGAQARARARAARARAEAERTRKIKTMGLLGVGGLLALLLLITVVRGIGGCVSKTAAPADQATAQAGGEVESTEATEAPTASPVQVDLVMIGDILQHAGVYESGFADNGTRNYDHIFAHIGDQIQGADIKVVNQETILGGEAFEFSGYPTFNGPQEMGDAEVKAGFNVILRATNHAMDMGYEGLHEEMSFWHSSYPDVSVLGAKDPEDANDSVDTPTIFEKDGVKVALLNYTFDLNGFEDPKHCVSLLEEQRVRETVETADGLADFVVVFPHWGDEYELQPVQWQKDMAQVLLDSGADVIIGGHPHVIEPVEVLTTSDGRKVPCFWSVGNFVSTQVDNENLVGGVAKVTMVKDANGSCSIKEASFVPTVTHKGIGTDMTTYLLRDYTDELAATNYLELNGTDNTTLTKAWANEFCTQVLGSGFDTNTEQISFGPEAFVAGAATQATPGATTQTTSGADATAGQTTTADASAQAGTVSEAA